MYVFILADNNNIQKKLPTIWWQRVRTKNAASVFLRGLATLMISPVTSFFAGGKNPQWPVTSLIFMPNISVGDVLATRYSLPSESGEAGWQLPATRSRWLLWGPSSSSWAWWASWPGPPRTRLVGQWPELDNFSLNSQCVVIKLCCEWYISLKVPQRWSSFIKDLDSWTF